MHIYRWGSGCTLPWIFGNALGGNLILLSWQLDSYIKYIYICFVGKALMFVGPPKHVHTHTVDETLCIFAHIILISPSASLSGADSRACSELHISAYGEVYNNFHIKEVYQNINMHA